MKLNSMLRAAFLATVFGLSATNVIAQGAEIAFGSFQHDSTIPVEVTADTLTIDQSDGSAIFSGNVLVGQGELRMTASKIRVEYATGDNNSTGEISRLLASGGVTLVNGAEAAESSEATYTIGTGQVIMIGNVILTQGQNALAANRMVVNLNSGTAEMTGRVRTILQTGDN